MNIRVVGIISMFSMVSGVALLCPDWWAGLMIGLSLGLSSTICYQIGTGSTKICKIN
jgi:hypothetical protein